MTVTAELPKAYDPSAVEARWYRRWMEDGWFRADATAPKAPFTIVIPPPNVTGSLHMGHALTVAIQDTLVRWRRMQGYNALWLPGVDHAGIATQMVVERMLIRTEGKSRHDLGRDEFLRRVWQWKEENAGRINDQLQALGCSCDWDRLHFTMDPKLSRAVREAFVRLHEQGLIYRARRLINWCTRCYTALSDLEVEHADTDGSLWHIAYPVTGGSERLVVATTRPETMLGDTAVAVHPEDERFRHLIGQTVDLPLTGRKIPIIGDAILVDREFGTGAVKVTPGHDFNDFETAQRHGLPLLSILDLNGRVIDPAPEAYRGLPVAEARTRVVADLEAAGLLVKVEPHKLSVGRCQRCDTVVEPMLSMQWFVNARVLAEPAIAAVETGKTTIIPESWNKTWTHWMTNIKDWCISRQLWWGHRIPAWYCACGEVIVAREEPATCPKCGGSSLTQDEDVLDTWFSSGLWPFSTLGWPDQTRDLKTFYPTSVMETGYDILFFWVARMMMMGLHFMGEVPFRTVFLHAMVVDEHGEKMSKVKGNVIDPLDIIHGASAEALLDKARRGGAPESALKNIQKSFPEGLTASGCDALRFTLAAMAAQGRNIRLAIARVEGYRHFANKIWNAARFALMNLSDFHDDGADRFVEDLAAGGRLSLADRWILSRLQRTASAVDAALESFRINDAANELYRFIWTELCDWYIELAKPSLYGGKAEGADPAAVERRRITQGTLAHCLKTACELLHPIMPFITEEIWQHLPKPSGNPQSIMITVYPTANESLVDEEAERAIGLAQEVIVAVRNLRAEFNIGPSVPLAVTAIAADAAARSRLVAQHDLIRDFGRLGSLTVESGGEPPHGTVSSVVSAGEGGSTVQVCVRLEGQVDAAAEAKRIEKEIAKADKEREQVTRKLSDEKFLARAPADVVEKERGRLAEVEERTQRLQASLRRLQSLA